MTRLWLAGLAVLAACGSHHRDACETAFEHAKAVTVWPDGLTSAQKDELERGRDAATASGIAHCRADRWSAETTSCMTAATSSRDVTACLRTLTPAQAFAYDGGRSAP